MALLLSASAFAQRGPGNGNCFNRGDRAGVGICDNLDLTDDQQTKVDALRVTHLKATLEKHDQLMEKEVKLNSLLNDATIDQKEVEKMVKDISNLKSELMLARINHRMEVRELLNDEQKVKFDMMSSYGRPCRQMGRF